MVNGRGRLGLCVLGGGVEWAVFDRWAGFVEALLCSGRRRAEMGGRVRRLWSGRKEGGWGVAAGMRKKSAR